jgi:hypothetical protein
MKRLGMRFRMHEILNRQGIGALSLVVVALG